MTNYKRDTAFSDIKDIATMGQKLDGELDVIGNKIAEVVKKIKKLVGALDEIRLAAKSIRNLKIIAGEMEKIATI